MKIRIRENSIRLRLLKSEIEEFFISRKFSQATDFGITKFRYTLEVSESKENLFTEFLNNEIKVYLPVSFFDRWKETEQVGFSGYYDLGDGKKIFIKVEKDFVCLDETDEDQSDNFPNPALIQKK